jgi:hypothetical protein
MASQSGGEAGSSSAAAQTATPPAGGQPDELLCTICGLTACWTAPGKPPRPAVPPADATDKTPSS